MRSLVKGKSQNVHELPGVSVIADYHAADTIQEMTILKRRSSFMSKKDGGTKQKGKNKGSNHKTSGSANGKNGYH